MRVRYVSACEAGKRCRQRRATGTLVRWDTDGLLVRRDGSDSLLLLHAPASAGPLIRVNATQAATGFRVGGIVGLALGGLGGAAAAVALCNLSVGLGPSDCESEADAAVLGLMIGAPVGGLLLGALGAGIGALVPGERWAVREGPLYSTVGADGVVTRLEVQNGTRSRRREGFIYGIVLGAALGGTAAVAACPGDRYRTFREYYPDGMLMTETTVRVGLSRSTCRIGSSIVGAVLGGLAGRWIGGGKSAPRWSDGWLQRLAIDVMMRLDGVGAAATVSF